MKKWDAYIIGDINVDVTVPNIDALPAAGQEVLVETMALNVGGGAALFTLGLAKLGANTVFKGCVGNDLYGKFILAEFESKKIDTSLLTIDTQTNTGVSIGFTNAFDRSFITYLGTNGKINMDDIQESDMELAGHIHVTGYRGLENHAQYMRILKKIKAHDTTVSLDVGWDDTGLWYDGIFEMMEYIDVFFMNETEAKHYCRCETAMDAIEKMSNYSKHIVIKMGQDGSMAKKDGELKRADAFIVTAVDTTGAGDSFNAGYIYGFIKGMPVEECLRYGNACGALSVTQYGGNAGFPTQEELLNFLMNRS